MERADVNGLTWRKSRHSGANGGDCVEVAIADPCAEHAPHKADEDRLYLMRDSKNSDGPVLAFTPSEWEAFIGRVMDDEFADM